MLTAGQHLWLLDLWITNKINQYKAKKKKKMKIRDEKIENKKNKKSH